MLYQSVHVHLKPHIRRKNVCACTCIFDTAPIMYASFSCIIDITNMYGSRYNIHCAYMYKCIYIVRVYTLYMHVIGTVLEVGM